MKVIIAGGRDFNDFDLLDNACDKLLRGINSIEIVSGKAKGADSLGMRYANENYYKLSLFPADWDKYGKSAGYKRNLQMAEYADALIAFWDGKSRGTKMMIELAKSNGLKVSVIYYTTH